MCPPIWRPGPHLSEPALSLVVMIALILIRVPVAIALLVVSLAGYAYIVSPDAALARLGSDAYRGAAVPSLTVVPFFIFMGMLLSHANLGRDLYLALDKFLCRMRGGLAIATLGASALLFGQRLGHCLGFHDDDCCRARDAP
jgi:TRAP-type mannitol/chloroaromatic compound transport system permease large subunit